MARRWIIPRIIRFDTFVSLQICKKYVSYQYLIIYIELKIDWAIFFSEIFIGFNQISIRDIIRFNLRTNILNARSFSCVNNEYTNNPNYKQAFQHPYKRNQLLANYYSCRHECQISHCSYSVRNRCRRQLTRKIIINIYWRDIANKKCSIHYNLRKPISSVNILNILQVIKIHLK